jgi:N-acyl homoserine lactone hydrolase
MALSPGDIRTLRLATVLFPAGHPRCGEKAPVNALLIKHPAGDLLVDTGIGPPHPLIDRLYQPERRDLEEALAAAGSRAADIRLVVNTHLHFDHCGGNRQFAGVPVIVQQTELQDAGGSGYTIPEFVDFPGAVYSPVNGRGEVLPGLAVIPAPGHTRGHQAVAVSTSAGPVVIGGQAAETAAAFRQSADPSVTALRALRPVRVLFSHDGSCWEPTRGRA